MDQLLYDFFRRSDEQQPLEEILEMKPEPNDKVTEKKKNVWWRGIIFLFWNGNTKLFSFCVEEEYIQSVNSRLNFLTPTSLSCARQWERMGFLKNHQTSLQSK